MPLNNALNAIFIRHGQTEGNRKGIVQGISDSKLTEEGILSIRQKAVKLKKIRFDSAFCSDLQRAVSTFDVLREEIPSLPDVNLREDLREIDFGDLTGRRKEEIMPIILKHKADTTVSYPNGESGDSLISRVRSFFDFLRNDFAGKTVLIVSHYGVMETALKEFSFAKKDDSIVISPDEVWKMTFTGDDAPVFETLKGGASGRDSSLRSK